MLVTFCESSSPEDCHNVHISAWACDTQCASRHMGGTVLPQRSDASHAKPACRHQYVASQINCMPCSASACCKLFICILLLQHPQHHTQR